MIEIVQKVIQAFCLSVLVLLGAGFAIHGIVTLARRFLVRVKAIGLALLFSVAVAVAVIFGGSKTHALHQVISPFAPQIQHPPLAPTSLSTNHVPIVAATSPRASATMPFRAAKWNVRGAWNDSFRCAFPDDWFFPFGTNHLDRVEVCSQGRVLPRYGSTDVIADVGVPLQIVNPITSFGYGPTDHNTYIFSWTNAVVGRVLHEGVANAETIDASIELFRSGDVAITTNGVTELIPRVLPFPHDGFGQDEDWVSGNFTNAAEILSMGYPQWVDAQVGENLTNGLYKFTVTVPDVPPETVQLVVGDYSVAVTNAGDYVFLLEKGIRHQIHLSPCLDGVEYSCADECPCGDAPLRSGAPPMRGTPGGSPYIVNITATGDSGNGAELVVPTRDGDGHVLFWPWLSLAPSSITTSEFPVIFVAGLFDIPAGATPSVVWKKEEEIVETGETFMLNGMGDDDIGTIDVFATYRDVTLHGVVTINRHVRTNYISLGGDRLVIVEDSYTNAPDDVVSGCSTAVSLHLEWALAETGQLKLEADCAGSVAVYENLGDGIELPVSLALTWNADYDEVGARDLLVYCSSTPNPGTLGTFTFSFTPEDEGASLTNTVSLQVVKVKVEAEANWPSNKVRHVFGPKERFTITTTPHMPVYVETNSYAIVSNDQTTVTAPDRNGPFTVYLSPDTQRYGLSFNCLAPTMLKGENPRNLYGNELRQLGIPLTAACAAMHIDTRLEPLNVSFQHIRIYEGYAPPINRTGWYQDIGAFPDDRLEHGQAAGAGSGANGQNEGVTTAGNLTENGDFVASYIGDGNPYYDGSYQLSIPVYWFADGGSITNRLSDSVQTMQIYSNGTMRVNKNGVTWEQPLGEQGYQVME